MPYRAAGNRYSRSIPKGENRKDWHYISESEYRHETRYSEESQDQYKKEHPNCWAPYTFD